jgi:hypothetical protein
VDDHVRDTPLGQCTSSAKKFGEALGRARKKKIRLQLKSTKHRQDEAPDSIPHRLSAMAVNYVLHESAVGYSIYEVVRQADSIGVDLPEVRESMNDVSKFSKLVQLVSFNPWQYVSSPTRLC